MTRTDEAGITLRTCEHSRSLVSKLSWLPRGRLAGRSTYADIIRVNTPPSKAIRINASIAPLLDQNQAKIMLRGPASADHVDGESVLPDGGEYVDAACLHGRSGLVGVSTPFVKRTHVT